VVLRKKKSMSPFSSRGGGRRKVFRRILPKIDAKERSSFADIGGGKKAVKKMLDQDHQTTELVRIINFTEGKLERSRICGTKSRERQKNKAPGKSSFISRRVFGGVTRLDTCLGHVIDDTVEREGAVTKGQKHR